MDVIGRIKQLCKERNISFHRLESECGFANGYIGKLKADKISADRLYRIAEYLNVEPEYLMNGKTKEHYTNEPAAELAQAIKDNPELGLLFDVAKDSTPEDINTIYQVLLALKRKERQ